MAAALPDAVAAILHPDESERIRQELLKLPAPPGHPHRRQDDWRGAAGVFLLVFLSTLPVVLPFICMRDAVAALRVSHLISIGLLLPTGYFFGCCAELRPWRTGVAMVLVEVAMVALTMAMGG